MPSSHRRTPDRALTLTAIAVGIVASAAVLVPVVLVRGDDRPPVAAPTVGSVAPSITIPASAPAPPPAGPVRSRPRSRPAPPVPPATTVRPPATRPPATRPPLPGIRAASWVGGLCLGTGAGDPEGGAPLVQQPCGSALARRFRFGPGPDGAVALVDRGSGLCVDVSGGSSDDGVTVMLWPCSGGDNQFFTRRPVPGSGGRSQLVAAHSGKCLDVLNRSTAAGAEVEQFSCHSANEELQLRNQSWLLDG
jgi:hypothetical protein